MSIHVPPDVRDELLARFLRWANGERVMRLGLEPLDELPQAEPWNPFNCLICRSLGGTADSPTISAEGNRLLRIRIHATDSGLGAIPPYVFAVACAFDESAFPELVLPDRTGPGYEWTGDAKRKAQAIIDRLATEIRAQRETEPSPLVDSRQAAASTGRAPFPCRGASGRRSSTEDAEVVTSGPDVMPIGMSDGLTKG